MTDRQLGYPPLLLGTAILAALAVIVVREFITPASVRVIAFDRVGNLRVGDPVKIRGATMGIIRKIDLSGSRTAVSVSSPQPFQVYPGYRIWIADRGLVGDRMVEIQTGDSTRAPIAADTLQGIFEPGISEWVGKAWVLKNLMDTLTTLSGRLLEGTEEQPSFAEQFATVVEAVDQLTTRLADVTRVVNAELSRQLDSLARFVSTTNDVTIAVAAAAPEYITRVEQSVDDILKFVTQLDGALQALTEVLEKAEDPDNLLWSDDIVEVVKTVSEVRRVVRDIRDGTFKLKLRITRWKD